MSQKVNPLLTIVLACAVACTASAKEKESADAAGEPADNAPPLRFRVIAYNVLVGFRDQPGEMQYLPGSERKQIVAQWLAEQAPDVVAFQELNGYAEEQLRKEAATWGHPHAVLCKKSAYFVGLTSKKPITVVERHLEGMHHGLLHCRTSDVDFFVAHLSPHKYQHRQKEVEMILQRVTKAMEADALVIVLGDLNALSPQDRELMDETKLVEYYRCLEEKYDFHKNLNQGKLDFSVIGVLLRAGLIDVYVKHRGESKSLPGRRIDYILAGPKLSKRSIRAEWVVNEKMSRLSDHYPVIADFDWTLLQRQGF